MGTVLSNSPQWQTSEMKKQYHINRPALILTQSRKSPMDQRPVAELRPLPPGGWWLRDDSVYPDPLEYWIIEQEDGSLQLVENIF